jgi:hypothetical protein
MRGGFEGFRGLGIWDGRGRVRYSVACVYHTRKVNEMGLYH